MNFASNRRKWTSVFNRASRQQRRAGAKPGLQMLHLEDRVTPALFAITQDNVVAEALGYGPTAITESSSAFVSTLEANVVHTQWKQVVTATIGELFTIDWQFSTPKTLSQRFADAVTLGEPVTWTVNSTLFGTQTYSGDWRFSTGAGDMAARFAGSGTSFSNDDGMWGAGNGLINGDAQVAPVGVQANIQWGHGNFNTSDAGDTLYENGVITSVFPVGFKNLMYLVGGGTLSATLAAGSLTIADTDATGLDNQLTAVISGTDLVITDANEQFTSAPAGGTLSNGGKTLTIPLASLPNGLVINTVGGSDSYTADFTGGNLPTTTFNGGAGTTDKLAIVGGATTTQTFNFTNENDGSVVLAGAIAGTVNYTGLEPVTSTIDATNVILNYSGVSETIAVTASGAQTKVDSTAGEVVTFDNPTALLEINAGDGTDTVNVTSFGTGFNAALDIDGEAGTGDIVNLNAAVTYAANKNLTVSAETINANAAQVLSGTGAINLTAGQNIVVGASLTGGTGGTTLVGQGTTAGPSIGILVQNSATVTATGAGAVSLDGTGRGNALFGVRIRDNATVTSGGGNVSVTGLAKENNSVGVLVDNSNGLITSGGAGTVTVLGTTLGTGSIGVLLNDSSKITSGGAGAVDVDGLSNGGGRGVWVFVNSQITSGGGNVTVDGSTGANGAGDNYGVLVENVNAAQPGITSGANGNVTITGISGGTGGVNNVGVWLRLNDAIVSAGGSGTLTVAGTGGPSTGSTNHGVLVEGTGSTILSGGGSIGITGFGGGTGGSTNNVGVLVQGGGSIAAPAALGVSGTKGANTTNGISVTSSISAVGQASLTGASGSDISIPAGATANFGSLTATTTGSASITEDSATVLAGSSVGGTFTLASTGGISQTAAVTVGSFSASNGTGGNIDLGTSSNTVTTFAASNAGTNGSVLAKFAGTTTVGTVGAVVGVTANNGTGAVSLTADQSLVVNNSITGGTGGTTLLANGTAAAKTVGVLVQGGAVVTATGAGGVSVTGTGGGLLGDNFGVRVTGTGSKVTSGGGNVSVTGTGGAGTGNGNVGVIVDLNAMITSGGNGTVTVLGTGGPGTGTSYHGVLLNDAGVITSGGTGKVDVTGIAKGSSDGRGVWVFVDSQITSGGGDVSVTGTGGSGGNSNYGINLNNNNAGKPSVTSGGSGTVTVTGTGGSAGNNNFGITLDLVTSISSGGSGKVTVVGTGGGNAASGGANHGVNLLVAGATITSGGGNVTVTGTGGTSGGQSFGISMPNNSLISSGGAGSVVVIANAGTQLGGATQRHGLFIRGGSDITSGGAGTVTVTGTGGTNGAGSFGVNMLDTGTTITSGGGNVQVTGNGGTGGTFNLGVVVDLGSDILAAGTGTVSVNGNGGSGAASTGVFIQGTGSTITSSGGAVSVTGAGASGNFGIQLVSNGQITSGTNAAITVTTDSIDIPAGTAINSGTGKTTLQTRTAGTKINLGGADVLTGSPLTLGLTDPELDRVTAGTIQIGSASNGNIDVTSPITINTNLNLSAAGGKTATLGASINAGTGNVTFSGATGAVSVVSKLSSWTKSTVIDNGGPSGDWIPTRTTPPAAGTFTLLPVPSGNPFVNGTDAADIGGGGDAFGAAENVEYYRTTFTLPSTTGLTARVRFSVDNNAQVFINGQEVAREVSLVVGNFNSPTYPEFQINPDGTITTIQSIDQTFNFTNWIAGTNELVVAVRNTQNPGDVGGLYFRMDITIDQAITIVPSGSGVDATANTTTLGTDNTLGIAINGTTVDTQYQQLNVAGGIDITGSKLLVSGSHTAVSGNSFVIVNNDGADPIVGTFAGLLEGAKVTYAGGSLYITYKGGDGNDVVLNSDPTVNGTAGADKLVVTPTATGYDYKLNADPTVSVVGTVALTFNGLDGDDTLIANLNTFALPNIAYNGGNQDTPASAGNNAVFGDVLVVTAATKTHTATYLGDGVAGAADNDGTVAILGQGTITFTQLEPVDLIGLAVANVTFANANDVVTVANGKDSGTNTLDALVVSGTSGGVAFEQVHLRNNALVNIDTVTGGTDGNDTVVIAGASNTHGNVNLTLNTGAGTDTVTVSGSATFSGSIAVTTGDLAINAAVSATGGSVTGTVAGSTTISGTGSVGANGTLNIASQKNLVVGGPIFGTTITLAFGLDDAGRTADVTAAINGTSASITGDGGVDSITVSKSGTAPLTLDGAALGDSYTVTVGTLGAAVSVVDSGVAGTDSLTVNGTAAANTFEVNTATGGDSKVVVDGTQTVNYSKTLEVLNLDGGDAGDTFNVFFTQGGPTSFLPATVSIAETGATGTDVANLSGTDGDDVIDANFTATRTTTSGATNVTYANGKLETLNVFSKDGLDLVRAKAVSLTGGGPVVNLDGGSPSAPIALTGDILILDITGQTGLNTANIKTPDGSVSSTSHNLLSWVDFETIPTAKGLGGTFDFGTATSPIQVGPYAVPSPASYWTRVANTDTFASKGSYGWNTVVNGYDRGNASPNPAQTTFQNLLRDGNWFGPANVSRTFSVAAVAAGSYQVSVTLGDTAVVMDNVYVTIEGSAQQLVPTTLQNQFVTITGTGSDANADGKLDIAFVDKGGTHSYWHVNALDVRPLDLISPITITRADGLATPLPADGTTKTTYFAAGFFPDAIVTVATTNGKIVSTDVDPFLLGAQVKADATGKATFEFLHPTGNGPVTLSASAAVVVDALGSFVQNFTFVPIQKIDFNAPGTPTEAGYFGFGTTLYAGPATNGLGWLQTVQAGDRGAAAGNLFRDFVFNSSGTATRGEFNIDLPAGDAQAVTVYLGDPAVARDRLQVEAFNGTAYVVLATEIATVKTNSLTFNVTPVDIGGGNFQIRLRFSDLGGSQNGWSVQGIEYRSVSSQGVLGIAPTGAVAGDGTAVTTYAVSAGPIGGLATVSAKYGAIQGTDASTVYDGFQVLLDGSGGGTFAIKSPVVASGSLASPVSLVTVNGSHAGGFAQQYTGAKVSYDFGPLTAPVAGGFKGLNGATKSSAQTGVGFTATAGDFDRNPASFPNVNKTATPDLFRDGVSGSGTGTFQVLVQAGATNVAVRVYAYDANSTRGNLTVAGEGGAKQTLPTSLTVPAVFDVVASDTNNDGFLDISIAGFSTWVMNGVEVG